MESKGYCRFESHRYFPAAPRTGVRRQRAAVLVGPPGRDHGGHHIEMRCKALRTRPGRLLDAPVKAGRMQAPL